MMHVSRVEKQAPYQDARIDSEHALYYSVSWCEQELYLDWVYNCEKLIICY